MPDNDHDNDKDDKELPDEAKADQPTDGEILEPPDHEIEGEHQLGDQHVWEG